MRMRLLTIVFTLVGSLLLVGTPQVSAGIAAQITVCVENSGGDPIVGALVSSLDVAWATDTGPSGCAIFPFASPTPASIAVTVTPPPGSLFTAATQSIANLPGTYTITLLAVAPTATTAPQPTATQTPVTPTETAVAGTGSLQILKADCAIDEVVVTQGDSTLDAPGCEPGHATFALYLYGDGTDAVVATAETHNGWTELLLAPGDYVIVEDGTWAQTTATVTEGAITWVVFHNPVGDVPVPPAPAPAPAPAKVTTLPKTGSGDGQTSGMVLIGAAGVLLMVSGVVITSRRRTM